MMYSLEVYKKYTWQYLSDVKNIVAISEMIIK